MSRVIIGPEWPGVKKATEKLVRPSRPRIGWSEALRAIQADDVRSEVLSPYRALGFTPEDFGTKRSARECLVEALIRSEDRIELEGSRRAERIAQRSALKEFRRRLEQEIDP
jgi:hypothetical protein